MSMAHIAFEKEAEGIYRLKVPFEKIYTSVFLVIAENGMALVDTATTAYDVDNVIVPAIEDLGYTIKDIQYIVLTHRHYDHDGGLPRLLELSPTLQVVENVGALLEGVCTYQMDGHDAHCIGVFCAASKTLIAGDGLQGNGLDDYPCNVPYKEAYLETIERIRQDESIATVLFSHSYRPWHQNAICGRDHVLQCLDICLYYLEGEKE